jgi:histidine triad (HIT) family protein
MDCIFCKIINGEISSYKVFEDDLVFAFLDIKPLTRGHTLIIPKKHFVDILDIDNQSLARIVVVAKELASKFKLKLDAEGFNLRQSNGSIAHQDVFHFHMHLVPRYKNDGIDLNSHHTNQLIDVEEVFEKL